MLSKVGVNIPKTVKKSFDVSGKSIGNVPTLSCDALDNMPMPPRPGDRPGRSLGNPTEEDVDDTKFGTFPMKRTVSVPHATSFGLNLTRKPPLSPYARTVGTVQTEDSGIQRTVSSSVDRYMDTMDTIDSKFQYPETTRTMPRTSVLDQILNKELHNGPRMREKNVNTDPSKRNSYISSHVFSASQSFRDIFGDQDTYLDDYCTTTDTFSRDGGLLDGENFEDGTEGYGSGGPEGNYYYSTINTRGTAKSSKSRRSMGSKQLLEMYRKQKEIEMAEAETKFYETPPNEDENIYESVKDDDRTEGLGLKNRTTSAPDASEISNRTSIWTLSDFKGQEIEDQRSPSPQVPSVEPPNRCSLIRINEKLVNLHLKDAIEEEEGDIT